jgi:uncharacterized membrane protein
MGEHEATAHRLTAYTDAVFAVIVTIMVLGLDAPDQPAFSALWPLWPTVVSYAASYLFIAILWINFAHLFLVSFLPFATAWVARTKLASPPVVLYAGLFVCIDIAYNVFERDILAGADAARLSDSLRRSARRRSLTVLGIFTAAMLIALAAPLIGFLLICGGLILHVRPDVRDRSAHDPRSATRDP